LTTITTNNMKNTICLVVLYSGPFPSYFDLFINSCKRNPTVNFIIFCDNIQYIKLSISDFKTLANKKLGLKVVINGGWKYNDFKPAIGKIFNDYLSHYDFWGWCDLDIIFGDIREFINDALLEKYDFISTKEKWTAGHFCLFKNNELGNSIFEQSPDFTQVYQNPEYFAFEECAQQWSGDAKTFNKIRSEGKIVSLYHTIRHMQSENKLRIYMKNIIREYPQTINYKYNNGKWIDLNNNESFFYYHLIVVKKIWRFYIPKWKSLPNIFYITPLGICKSYEYSGIGKVWWLGKRSIFCLSGIIKSIKKQKMNASTISKKLF
jgi:hypothetical protein